MLLLVPVSTQLGKVEHASFTYGYIRAIIKCFGLGETSWPVVFVGQTVSACAQCFILELPPKIAATWFPSSEISRATSIGVMGNSMGWLFGFLIPPLILKGT